MGLLDLLDKEQIEYLRKLMPDGPSREAKTLDFIDKTHSNPIELGLTLTMQRLNEYYSRDLVYLYSNGLVRIELTDEGKTILNGARQIWADELT